jgi:type IV pilus assembly protein PilC
VEFRCRLASASGQIVEGVYAAESESRLRRDFEEKGMYVLSVQPKGAVGAIALRLPSRAAIPSRELLIFSQELATLIKAGMPLLQSLELLKRRVESPVFQGVLNDVYERVRGGAALSDAFIAQGDIVPGVYTASLLAGERSGNLESVLRRYVDYAKTISNVRRKAISALIYPALLIVMAFVLVSIIVLRVVPEFSDFYASFGAQLPLFTRMIVALSNFIRGEFLVLVVVFVAAVAAAVLWVRRPGQRIRIHRFILSMPMLGEVTGKFATSQLARTLATLLGGGLPLVNALEIASRSVGNRFLASELAVVERRVREGASLSASMTERGVFPDVAVKMAEVGEQTGALQEMLNTVADFYDEDIATTMERFETLAPPILLVVMGVVVAALLLALYIPVFQLSSVVSR